MIDFNNFAILLDLAGFRLIKSEQYRHQRGFSGAILTQQRMDFTAPQLQRNIVIRHTAGEFFSDIEHFNNVF